MIFQFYLLVLIVSHLFHIVSQQIQVYNCIWIRWLGQCMFRCLDKGCCYTRLRL